jgi:hypothetical protein
MIISKGMALIHNTADRINEVLVHIFEGSDFYKGKPSIVYFHKKIHGSVSLADSRSQYILDAAKNEISELIY